MTTAELLEARNTKPQDPSGPGELVRDPLFEEGQANDLRTRWQEIQGTFVDDPKGSVEQADRLVAGAIQHLTEGFASQKASLEGTWSRGTEMSTEEMRQALRRYRSFFDRILSV